MRRRSADFRQYHKRCTGFTQTLHKGAPFFCFCRQTGGDAVPTAGGFAVPTAGDDAVPTAGGMTPYPRRGAKRKDNLRFSFLFGLLPFPCFLIWRRLPTCDRCEKGNGRGFFLCYGRTTFGVRPLEQPVCSVRYRSATHVVSSTQARHPRVAQFVSALL